MELAALDESGRQVALARYRLLAGHLHDQVPLPRVAAGSGVPLRTLQRWSARYRAGGLSGLARTSRADAGRRRVPPTLVSVIEGLALRRPPPSIAVVHREALDLAREQGWPEPSYRVVYDIVSNIDPAMLTLAHDGRKRYKECYDLIFRREAGRANAIWQADHTQLDIWVLTPAAKPARPWLTAVEDDHSRAVAGYTVSLEAPSALNTALAWRQAIWRKTDPAWPMCGLPEVFHVDHGSDFTSQHIETVAADLHVQLIFSKIGEPRGRGKVERLFETLNQQCLAHLPGYAPTGTPERAQRARLTLAELDEAIGRFIAGDYHQRIHSETGQTPRARWEAGGWLPRMPDSLDQLDLLLLTVAKARKVHPDGIHFQGLRYLDVTLAAYVGEAVTIRYDPRDVAEVRVFHHDRSLCRAICPDLAGETISLKDVAAARNQRRRQLRSDITDRNRLVDSLLGLRAHPSPPTPTSDPPPAPPTRTLKRYVND